jgi:NAD-dependent deacetylase
MPDNEALVVDALRRAEHVAVLTGAGVSAESGIPTFRDPLTGFWSNFRPEELATAEGFRRNPAIVWNWYVERRAMARAAQPNAGHLAIARLRSHVPKVTTITQNIDGLHQAAGSVDVIELHGNIHATRCFERDHAMSVDTDAELAGEHPACPVCGSLARPGVVWFGEALPEDEFDISLKTMRTCDVLLVVGTSGVVQPAASLGGLAQRQGATVAVVNPDPDAAIRGGLFLKGTAATVLPRLLKAAWENLA